MLTQPTLAERFVFGTPLEPADAPRFAAPRPTTALLGRILIAAIFIPSGIEKLTHIAGTASYMASMGVPWAHGLAIIAGLAELFGGLSILFGFVTRLGALGLIVFLIPTTLVFHPFWHHAGPQRAMQMANFMKNLAIIGGLCLLVANGAGRYSADAKLRPPRSE